MLLLVVVCVSVWLSNSIMIVGNIYSGCLVIVGDVVVLLLWLWLLVVDEFSVLGIIYYVFEY